MRRQWMGALAVVVAGSIVAAGCGSASSSPASSGGAKATSPTTAVGVSARARLIGALDKTGKVSSFKMTMSVAVTGLGASAPRVAEQAAGQFDLAAGLGELQMTVPASGSAGVVEMILDHATGTVYLKVPPSLAASAKVATAGRPWIAMKLSSLGTGQLGGIGSTSFDPTQVFAQLKKSASSITEVGTSTIGGVPVTEYAVSVNLADALGSAGSALPQFERGLLSHLKSLEVNYDVWVDGNGVIRRFVMTFPFGKLLGKMLSGLGSALGGLGGSMGGSSGSSSVTAKKLAALEKVSMQVRTDLYGYGVPVHIVVPPAGEVTTIKGSSGAGVNPLSLALGKSTL